MSIRLEGSIDAASYAAPEFTICPAKAEFSKEVTPLDTRKTPSVDSKSLITVTPGATGVTGETGSGVTGSVVPGVVTTGSGISTSPSSPKHDMKSAKDRDVKIKFNLKYFIVYLCLL
tara:strand:+ start:5720 stop:6070 length:351 start_codon:yes stop_codon:yes gene_type:complete